MAEEQLSGTIVVIIIAIGFQVCIILGIFAKRQIQRFTLRNRRGPHMHIGHGAPKPLRRESDRYLDYIPYIRHEPKLNSSEAALSSPNAHQHFYRSKAVEQFHRLEKDIASGYSKNYARLPGSNVRSFLLNCMNGPLLGVNPRQIHIVCDGYEHARHHYEDFDEGNLQMFTIHLEELQSSLQTNKTNKPIPSPMPLGSSSPHKRSRNRKSRSKSPNFQGSYHPLNNHAVMNALAAPKGERETDPLSVSMVQRGQAIPLRQRGVSQPQQQPPTVSTIANAKLGRACTSNAAAV